MSSGRPSPLRDAHLAAGGREPDHRGVPVDYGDPEAEHRALAEEAGLVDLTARDLLRASGRDHLSVLHAISTAVVEGLPRGSGVLTVLTTPKGRVVDLVAVARDEETSSLLLGGTGTGDALAAWVRRFVILKDCALASLGSAWGLLAVRGPAAASVMEEVLGLRPPHVPWGVTRAGGAFPGEAGLLVAAPSDRLPALWERLAGRARPCGRLADTYHRIATRTPASGSEINEEHNPWELRLDDAIRLDKGCYVGQEVVARLVNYEKIRRRLALLRTTLAPDAATGAPVVVAGREAARVTSAARLGDTTLALTFLPVDADETAVEVGDPPAPAAVVAPTG